MPYYKNGSLADRIEVNPLSLKNLIAVGQEILQGTAQVHIQGYLHLDIKPSNILFSDLQIPLLADFGQSRVIEKNGVISRLPPMYNLGMPPECLSSGVATVESDVY